MCRLLLLLLFILSLRPYLFRWFRSEIKTDIVENKLNSNFPAPDVTRYLHYYNNILKDELGKKHQTCRNIIRVELKVFISQR